MTGPSYLRSIATVSLSGSLPEKLEAAAATGFDGVEIFETDLLTFAGTPADVRAIAEGLGLAITLFQPFRDFEAMPEPQRGRNLDRAERKFDVMAALGCDLLLVCSNTQPAALADPARASADLAAMAERAGARGLRVGYEALAWGRHVRTWRAAWDIVRAADHPALGLIVDSFHTLALGDDPAGLAGVPGEKIFFIQLADAPRLSMDPLSWSRHFRNFPGQGQLPVASFLRAALASGYAGPISLEVFNDAFRAAPARQTARDGLRSLILTMAEAGAAPALPAPPRCAGVEFLEFAVDATSGEALGAFLAGLGFRPAGRHRSKAVTLWRQGRINLVLNGEPDSAAAAHFLLHGPSVCAMAFAVDDAARALERAAALLAPAWQEPTGSGERQIPALRAPDGTLIYLIAPHPSGRTIWEDDFILDPAVANDAGAGLAEIDHVAQALPQGRLDGFVLFYRAMFGLEAEALWELPDPYGLIQSRAMVSPERRLRLPLNISDSRETGTGRFVSAYAGAGVHHIAFAATDLFATVARLARTGAKLLPIPANYYADLAARFDLDPLLLARLQAANLLYDRDENGEFLHAYTAHFADRFFCEVVERHGYTQFGAANAAVRMAVQAAAHEAERLAVL